VDYGNPSTEGESGGLPRAYRSTNHTLFRETRDRSHKNKINFRERNPHDSCLPSKAGQKLARTADAGMVTVEVSKVQESVRKKNESKTA